MKARVQAVEYYLPENVLTNLDLATEFPEWSVDKISAKTGIERRHIAAPDQFSSHLAIAAGERLFKQKNIDRSTIEYLIVCTQSPDYYLPTTACLVQDGLGLRTEIGATDITLGCSGYIYALGLAKGLIESGQVTNVLVITADTYSKFINPKDKSVRTIFGDGSAATLITGSDDDEDHFTGITYGTNGAGAKNLIVPNGGLRPGTDISPKAAISERNIEESQYDIFMDGPEIFNFTLDIVPSSVDSILSKASLELDDIDLFVFHQANAFMLEHLRKKLGVPKEKFFVALEESGNTVSSTIPIALVEAERRGALKPEMRVMILGFGVGLSWGGMIVKW
ncbi:3-oxoacyl-ACP synthase III family protein [Salinibacterium sp. PAMC 21357]|uniref:3-oxoacyl-ACP synthase III family protein n=1 Tax=Salinibacterium sp. PAMC 21357 TaxID=1112215 RepID=UPI00028823FC|nr:ketoacyl-ACP synthase III [Salinibacterium sp. PAMC 21357]